MKNFLFLVIFISSSNIFSQVENEEELYKNALIYINVLNGDEISSILDNDIKEDLLGRKDLITHCQSKIYNIFRHLVNVFPESDRFIEYCFELAHYSNYQDEQIEYYQKFLELQQEGSYRKRQSLMGLAFIFLERKDVEKANKYFSEMLLQKPPLFTCGVAKDIDDSKINRLRDGINKLSKE